MRNLLTISAACEPSNYPSVYNACLYEENSFTKNFNAYFNVENVLKCSRKKQRRKHARHSYNGLLKKFEVHIRFNQELLTKVEI